MSFIKCITSYMHLVYSKQDNAKLTQHDEIDRGVNWSLVERNGLCLLCLFGSELTFTKSLSIPRCDYCGLQHLWCTSPFRSHCPTRHHPLLTSLAGMEHFEFPVYHKGEGGKHHGRNRVLLECSMLLLFSVTSLPFWPFFKVWLPSFLKKSLVL